VHTVQHANKDQGKCEKDGTPLPKGSAYRWWTVGFRSRYKHVRCMKSTCTPRRSELESSLVSSVMAAQEDAEANLQALYGLDAGGGDDVAQSARDALEDVAASIDEVVRQYRDQDEQFGGGGNTDSAQRADDLDADAQTLRDWQPDDEDPPAYGCDKHPDSPAWGDCEECTELWDMWRDDLVASAEQTLADMQAV
jgi:hypothetical protein